MLPMGVTHIPAIDRPKWCVKCILRVSDSMCQQWLLFSLKWEHLNKEYFMNILPFMTVQDRYGCCWWDVWDFLELDRIGVCRRRYYDNRQNAQCQFWSPSILVTSLVSNENKYLICCPRVGSLLGWPWTLIIDELHPWGTPIANTELRKVSLPANLPRPVLLDKFDLVKTKTINKKRDAKGLTSLSGFFFVWVGVLCSVGI